MSTIDADEGDLAGRVAVVTGATRGIGRAVARTLAAAGARVVVVGRSTNEHPNSTLPGTLEEAAEELRGIGADVLAVNADLGSPEETDRVVDETLSAFGRCDILVNNAAFMPSGPVLGMPSRRWLAILRINAVAPLQLCQSLVPGMLERGWGRVLNVSSGASNGGPPDLFMYGSSKQCLDRLTVNLHAEAGDRGVAFNAVQVGAVATEMHLYSAQAGILERQGTVVEKTFDPAAVADAFLWLLRQPSPYSGHVLSFDDLIALGVLSPP
ncbi:MAG: SDR family oxidoreductase [Acidobacteria bacterium]|nr:SDR family oxidoreductase [Acidobacteriota bacterium]